ncbi:MAG: DUF89 family protein [Deltaproteobacteria bacterium]|nr:DUF89 family protein [Deltaproteobacteria bacterium]
MKPELECASCLLTWLIERIAVLGREGDCYPMVRAVSGMIRDGFTPTANVGALANRSIEIADELIAGAAEHFEGIKSGNNQAALRALPAAKDFIESAGTPEEALERACALATAGNVSPIGVPSGAFRFEEVDHFLEGTRPLPAFRGDVHGAVRRASHILYATDNSGEIGFDGLLVSRLKEMGKRITLVVKEGPFFEDATREDVDFFGLDGVVDQVCTIPGFLVAEETLPPLKQALEECDLVISKGTGNFESLAGETQGRSTIFMLKAKCRPISRVLGVDIGEFAVWLEG